MTVYIGLIFFTLVLNIPFGCLRGRSRKLAGKLLWIHLPVPMIAGVRFWLHISWTWIPVLILAAFLGQYTGGRLCQPPVE